jgi:membrane protein required for colicin V production
MPSALPMALLDWVFLAVLALSFLIGAWRGLVFEVISLASWVAAFLLAQWFAADVARLLPMTGAGEGVRYAAGFGLTFVVALFAGGLVAVLLKKMVSSVGLAPFDRVLGAVFGLVRGMVVLLAIAVVVAMTPLKSAMWWKESIGAKGLTVVLAGLKPVLPAQFGKLMP